MAMPDDTKVTCTPPKETDMIPLYLPSREVPQPLADLHFPITTEQPDGLCLVYTQQKLGLKDFSEPKTGAVVVDFTSDAMQFRAARSSIRNEAIAKALGLKGTKSTTIIDSTAGLGRDSFMLATLGAKVFMLERSVVVAALLQDGLRRAISNTELADWLPSKLQFTPGQAKHLLTTWQQDKPDAIYLDPMFPHKKKSALVKKEMRLFQTLLGPDDDAHQLLTPALNLASKRVVVKRPDYAPFLNDTQPSMQIKSKKHRFDVYLK